MPNFLQKSLQPAVEWLTRLAGMESAATYRVLVERSLVGVYLIQDGRFPYCNRRMAEIFGYDSNDEIIRTRTVVDLVWPEDRELVMGNVRRRIEGKVETVHYGFRGLRRDGAMIEVEVLGSRVVYHGRPAVIGTLLDVTAERQSIEITESVMMSDPEHIQGVLRAMTEAGLRVAVDDFGKGYSSLTYLKMLPVHYLKIDRSFVHDLRDGGSDAAITHAIIAMAHSLNIRMVAEGVENRCQCDLLRDAGCQEAQGWLFAKPLEARDLPKLFRKAG